MPVETDTRPPSSPTTPTPGASSPATGSQARLGTPGLVVVESDEDVLLYETGHIPGAVKVDWHTELNDPVVRDYVDGAGFAELLEPQGHLPRRHRRHLRRQEQLVGRLRAVGVLAVRPRGRAPARRRPRQVDRRGPPDHDRRRRAARRPTYPVVERDDRALRAYKDDVLAHLGNPLIDVRSPEEYGGERTTAPAYPEEGALRAGHIPTAQSVPWAQAVAEDGTFKPPRRARRDLPRRRRPAGRRRRRRLLPHRRALEPHLVRAQAPARLRGRAQLRRLVDRVGQRRARADRRPAPSPASSPRADRRHVRRPWENRSG